MLASFFESNMNIVATAGILFAFFATVLLLWKCKDKLPRDLGRDFAVDGKLSAGNYRLAKTVFTDEGNYTNGKHYVFLKFEIE